MSPLRRPTSATVEPPREHRDPDQAGLGAAAPARPARVAAAARPAAAAGRARARRVLADRAQGRDARTTSPGSPTTTSTARRSTRSSGLVLMYAMSRLDYSRLRSCGTPLYGLLIGDAARRARGSPPRRAARSAGSSCRSSRFQPSELGKVLLVVALSAFLVDRMRLHGPRRRPRGSCCSALMPDDARDGRARPRHRARLRASASSRCCSSPARRGATSRRSARCSPSRSRSCSRARPAVGVEVLKPYQKDRLTSFLDPSADPADAGYQQQQSKIAIGSGEKTGRGVDNATQTGLNFLPEHHTDFIFAVVGETYGFAGCALVLSLVRAADMARAPHPHHREEPLRRADRRGHHRDAAVPALRQRRDERRHHAHHGRDRPAPVLRRLVHARHLPGPRPAAVDQRAGARDRCASRAGPPSSNEVST